MPKNRLYTLLIKDYDGRVTARLANGTEQLRKNFQVYEFRVNRDDGLDLACVSEYDLDTLQYMRALYGKSIMVTSTGRTPGYNKEAKGANDSKHQYMFDCLDFVIQDITHAQMEYTYNFLVLRGYTGIGRYPGGRFHIDRGYRKKLTVWDER
jgi:uncharacterized protein YcbK (DUF882 family)